MKFKIKNVTESEHYTDVNIYWFYYEYKGRNIEDRLSISDGIKEKEDILKCIKDKILDTIKYIDEQEKRISEFDKLKLSIVGEYEL